MTLSALFDLPLLAPEFSGRLCLTLAHSLWQAPLFAILAWGLARCWRKPSVERSYGLYVSALIASLSALLLTFWLVSRQPAPTPIDHLQMPEPIAHSPSTILSIPIDGPTTITSDDGKKLSLQVNAKPRPSQLLISADTPNKVEPLRWWRRLAPWGVLCYCIGVLVMLGRMGIGGWHAQRLSKSATPLEAGPVVDALNRLQCQWGLRIRPLLKQTERVVVPKVVGLLRPTILLPLTAATGLTAEELEMILAHELAHVRRYDMWVNLLQRLAEAVLFLNPAIWWLSRRISTLREYCCDELACRLTADATEQSRILYSSALLRVAELAQSQSPVGNVAALSADGRSPSELRRRIARLCGEPLSEPLQPSRGGLLTVLALAILLSIGPIVKSSVEKPKAVNRTTDSHPEPTPHVRVEPVKAETKAKSPATISGRIILPDGSPATTAGKLLTKSTFGNHTNINSAGRYTNHFTMRVSTGEVWLVFEADGFAPAWVGPLHVNPGETLDGITIALRPGVDRPLQLTNERGEPIAGATISMQPEIGGKYDGLTHEFTADSQGKLLLKHLANTRYRFTVTAPGYQPLRGKTVRVAANKVLRLTMIRSEPCTGLIRLADGTAAASAKVYLKGTAYAEHDEESSSSNLRYYAEPDTPYMGTLAATADENGRFTLNELDSNAYFLFAIEAADGTRAVIHDLRAGQQDVAITLPKRCDLTVKVSGDICLLRQGRREPFVALRQHIQFSPTEHVRCEGVFDINVPLQQSEDGGIAVFHVVAIDLKPQANKQQIDVRLNNDRETRKTVEIAPGSEVLVEYDLREENAASPKPTTKLDVRAQAKALEEWRKKNAATKNWQKTITKETPTDRQFAVNVTPVSANGEPTPAVILLLWKALEPGEEDPVNRVNVPNKFGFYDPVIWDDPGNGARWIRYSSASRNDSRHGKETQTFQFAKLRAGRYRITAASVHPDLPNPDPTPAGVTEPFELGRGNDSAEHPPTIRVRLEGSAALILRFLDQATGNAIDALAVRLWNAEGMPIVHGHGSGNFFHRTDQNGEITFSQLKPGKYLVQVIGKMAGPNRFVDYEAMRNRISVSVTAEKPTQAEIHVPPHSLSTAEIEKRFPFYVYGVVRDNEGKPMSDVEVRAATGMGTLLGGGRTQTDANGRYRLYFGPGVRFDVGENAPLGVRMQAAIISARKDGWFETNWNRQGGLSMSDADPDQLAEQLKKEPYSGKDSIEQIVFPNLPREVNFTMAQGGAIKGKLHTDGSCPLEKMNVALIGDKLPPGRGVFANLTIDTEGNFQVPSLPLLPADVQWRFRLRVKDSRQSFQTEPFTITEPSVHNCELRYESQRSENDAPTAILTYRAVSQPR